MLKKNNRVLLVDDETSITEMLDYNLSKEGYDVKSAADGYDAIEIAKDFLPNLIVLDVMMPRMDGIETCRRMREIPKLKDTYIIFLTARSEEFSEIAAFEAGADDYVYKPVKPRALMSRVAAYFRRETNGNNEPKQIAIRNLIIDKGSYTISKNGEKMVLPKKEFELLYYLAQKPNIVFTRDELLKNIWGSDVYVVPRTVDVHIRKIREKLGDEYIATIKGIGYKFTTETD